MIADVSSAAWVRMDPGLARRGLRIALLQKSGTLTDLFSGKLYLSIHSRWEDSQEDSGCSYSREQDRFERSFPDDGEQGHSGDPHSRDDEVHSAAAVDADHVLDALPGLLLRATAERSYCEAVGPRADHVPSVFARCTLPRVDASATTWAA